MAVTYIDGKRLRRMFIAGAQWLAKHTDYLNELNVYPVPDGDTGTNMSMTLTAIEEELQRVPDDDVDKISKIISEAAILGARGNSGTILSQILYGFLKGLLGKEKVRAKDIAAALMVAQRTAYSAVTNPVEGTILTVVRRVAEEAEKFAESNDDLLALTAHIKNIASMEVEKTMETLPKLKEAGVVDAGAKGFFYMLEGFEMFALEGVITNKIGDKIIKNEIESFINKVSKEEIKYRYCTEFIIETADFNIKQFEQEVQTFGDSLVMGATDTKVKVHIHSNSPGLILEYAMALGELSRIKIENMSMQHNNLYNNAAVEEKVSSITPNDMKRGKILSGIVCVADTDELGAIFIDNGAEIVILGGQTNNPSVKEIENAINMVKGDNVIILPNNKNVLSSANMASERSDKKSIVINTKSMTEGLFILENRDKTQDELKKRLELNISIEITKAVRDSKSENIVIKKNDYIALVNGKIEFAGADAQSLLKNAVLTYMDSDVDRISVLRGIGHEAFDTEAIFNHFEDVKITSFDANMTNAFIYIYIENTPVQDCEIAIVADAASDLIKSLFRGLPVYIVPCKCSFGGEYMRDDIEMTRKEFFERIYIDKTHPKSSQASPGDFKAAYLKVFAKGYKKIISIHVSGKKSGVQQAARSAKNMMSNGDDITILDSGWLSLGAGHIVLGAAKMAKANAKVNEIVDWVTRTKDRGILYISVGDLKFLQKGGRIGKAASMIGGVLKLKIIVYMKDGDFSVEKKTFGDKSALEHLKSIVIKRAKEGKVVMYNYYGTAEDFENLQKLIETEKQYKNIRIAAVARSVPSSGVHSGPGYGMAIFPDE